MIQLLIIDDEKFIREGLANYVDWTPLGIEVIGTAANGKAALEQIEEKKPELIISDIKMPNINGIELLKIIREKDIQSEVIFISAYKDFEYAQKAVEYGAFSYILKPIEDDILMDTVKKCTSKMLLQKQKEAMLDSTLLLNWITGKHIPSMKEQEHLMKQHLLPEDNCPTSVCLIKTNDTLYKLFFEELPNNHYILKPLTLDTDLDYKILLFFFETEITQEQYKDFINTYRDVYLSHNLNQHDFFIGFSSLHPTTDQIPPLYIEASTAFLSNQLTKKIVWDFESACTAYIGTNKNDYVFSHSKFLNLIKTKHKDSVIHYLCEMFFYFANKSSLSSLYVIKLECSKLLDYIILHLDDDHLQHLLSNNKKEDLFKKYIADENHLISVYRVVKNALFNIIDFLEQPSQKPPMKLVELALDYIHKNFQNNITLNEVAENLYITPSYLSKIFSQEMQLSFSKYMTKYRVTMAKKYLQDPQYKIYEIANMVGYTDIAHFTKVFKSFEGITPSQYRSLY